MVPVFRPLTARLVPPVLYVNRLVVKAEFSAICTSYVPAPDFTSAAVDSVHEILSESTPEATTTPVVWAGAVFGGAVPVAMADQSE